MQLWRSLFVALSIATLAPLSPRSALASQAEASPDASELRDCDKQQQLAFTQGQYSARVSDVVLRDEVVCYAFFAKKGQKLTITRAGVPQNADLAVYIPGYTFQKIATGEIMVGKHLMDIPEEERAGHATLPEAGRYTLAVIAAHGAAAPYTLTIAIR